MIDRYPHPLAPFRSYLDAALDVYIESRDGLAGIVGYHYIGEITRVAAPVHLTSVPRHAPNIHPSGEHLEAVARTGPERVCRAAIGLEHLARRPVVAVER